MLATRLAVRAIPWVAAAWDGLILAGMRGEEGGRLDVRLLSLDGLAGGYGLRRGGGVRRRLLLARLRRERGSQRSLRQNEGVQPGVNGADAGVLALGQPVELLLNLEESPFSLSKAVVHLDEPLFDLREPLAVSVRRAWISARRLAFDASMRSLVAWISACRLASNIAIRSSCRSKRLFVSPQIFSVTLTMPMRMVAPVPRVTAMRLQISGLTGQHFGRGGLA